MNHIDELLHRALNAGADAADHDLTGIHNSATCTANHGQPCDMCRWANEVERRPFPEQATYNLSEQQNQV